MLVGESGSGKSTLARRMVAESNGRMVRLNRDDLRLMIHNNQCTTRPMENLVVGLQKAMARTAIDQQINVVIDDTNLSAAARGRWEALSREWSCGVSYREIRMDTPLEECIRRDALREWRSRVGLPVIERQFLESGRIQINLELPVVIVDVDGTLADHDGIRSPYDESRVLEDRPHLNIINMVAQLALDHTVIVVSGRHSSCGDDTVQWLRMHNVPFHHIFMRHAWDNRSDVVVKKEILDAILKLVPKSQIDLVIDDRPRVIRMWRENGLKVFAARGEDLEDF